MKTPTEKETLKTIKNIRKATVAYIHILRKASKSMWFPDIKTTTTVVETLGECMKAIDEANSKFVG